jgi:hypothetical protein
MVTLDVTLGNTCNTCKKHFTLTKCYSVTLNMLGRCYSRMIVFIDVTQKCYLRVTSEVNAVSRCGSIFVGKFDLLSVT